MQNVMISVKKSYTFQPVLPKEHGTWMMLFLPYVLGVLFSSFRLVHVPLLLGWFLIYLSSTPFLAIVRNRRLKKKMLPWAVGYLTGSLVFLLPALSAYPFLLLLGSVVSFLLGMNLYYIRHKNERNLFNDLSGILIFSLGGAAAYAVGTGGLTADALWVALYTTLYFMGSAFYVKSMIRERKNPRFSVYSHLYHLALIPTALLCFPQTFYVLAYIPGILKDWLTPRRRLTPVQTGFIEIANGLLFLLISVYFMRLFGGNV